MAEPVNVAFLGVDHPHGAGWRELLANIEEDVRIAAIVPGYEGALTSLEERLAGVPRFDSVEQLLQWGAFDGAIVCLPNDQAPIAAELLARAGKHILLEKPGAGSARDLGPLESALAETGAKFQSGYMWRYDEGAGRIREMIAEGRFGALISVEMSFVTSDVRRRGPDHYLFNPEISSGGFFNWLACHFLDLLPDITGQRVVGVTARTGSFGATATAVEDGGAAIVELENGALGNFVGGYWIPRWAGECHWTIRGSERWVHWYPTRQGTGGVLEIHGPQPQWHAMNESYVIPHDATPGYGGRNGLALVHDWLTAIRTPGHLCRNSIESAIEVLRLIDGIYDSSRQNARIGL